MLVRGSINTLWEFQSEKRQTKGQKTYLNKNGEHFSKFGGGGQGYRHPDLRNPKNLKQEEFKKSVLKETL